VTDKLTRAERDRERERERERGARAEKRSSLGDERRREKPPLSGRFFVS